MTTSCDHRGHRCATAILPVLAAALLATGCGSSSPTSATTGNPPAGNIAAAAFRFSSCMRRHGVPDFPDPHVTSTPGQTQVGITLVAHASHARQFQAAQKACNGILPTPTEMNQAASARQEARKRGLLSFAQCVRSRGVTGFPDPNAQGVLNIAVLQAAGIDVHAPDVLAAARACIPASDGAVNAAAIEQAQSASP